MTMINKVVNGTHMGIDEEIKQHDDKKKVAQEERVKECVKGILETDEEITRVLRTDYKALRALRMLGIAGIIISLMCIIIGLALYLRPLMFNWGKKGFMFFFWFALGIITMILGIIFLVSESRSGKNGGIVLTNKRLIFNGGYFSDKAESIAINDVDRIMFKHFKGGSYVLKILAARCYHYEEPFDLVADFEKTKDLQCKSKE